MIIDIRIALQNVLKTIPNISKAYYEDAPDDAVYPYLVYELNSSDADGSSTEVFSLYINVWDNKSNTTILETIMDDINDTIDNVVIDANNISIRALLDTRLNINDSSDARLKRREYRYSLRTIRNRRSV